VVHRDLKPGNVMLTKSGAKLMDFGLAREVKRDGRDPEGTLTDPMSPDSEDSITKKGTVVGTFQYMAPEQLEGKRVDARCDIWALGCVLYEMATGKRAFEGSTPVSVISAIMRDEPRKMAELAPLTPPALEQVVVACLAKDPDGRIQSAHDVRLQLGWLASSTPESLPSAPNMKFMILAGIGSILLIVVAVGSYSRFGTRQDNERIIFEALTHRPITVFNAAFLPDNNSIIYSAATKGNSPQLFVLRPDDPDPQPIGSLGTHLLSVSSRGELAVLTDVQYMGDWKFNGTLARMSIGGAPRELLHGVLDADWDPSGSQLAVIRFGAVEYPIGRSLYHTKLGYLSNLHFSPGGELIAFTENTSGAWGPGKILTVVNLKGTARTLLAGYAIDGLCWESDGKSLLVSAMRDSLTEAIYKVDLRGRVHTVVQSAGGLRIHDVAKGGGILATRDDWRDAVMVHRPGWPVDRDLSWLDSSGDGQLSKDGNLVVFTEESSRVAGDQGVVCLQGTDGSPRVQLCTGTNYEISPDGKWVVTVDRAKSQRLVLQPLGIGEVAPLPPDSIEAFYGALWFPSGDSLLLMGQYPGRPFRLFIQNIKGGLPRPFSEEGTLQPAISPDGSFVIVKKGAVGYAKYRFDGSPSELLPWITPKEVVLPKMVDSRTVLVASGRNLPYHVDKVDLISGRRTRFLDLSPENQAGLTYCRISGFSDDFKSYAYEASWTTSSLFLIQSTKHTQD
jgi:hypothetical protein